MNVTIGDLTNLLRAVSTETVGTLNRQIRYWTDQGCLGLSGDLNIGTGRSRTYSPENIAAAAIAVELTKFGWTIGLIKSVCLAAFVELSTNKDGMFSKTYRGEDDAHVLVLLPPDRENAHIKSAIRIAFVRRDRLGELVQRKMSEGDCDSFTVIDLAALWAKIR